MKRRTVWIGMWACGLGFWLLLAYRLNVASQPSEAADTGLSAQADTGDPRPPAGQSGTHAGDSGRSEERGGDVATSSEKGDDRAPGGCVDANVADADELISLPGIGPVLASRIIEYRGSREAGENAGAHLLLRHKSPIFSIDCDISA
jgi:hypothetical protein